MDAAIAWLTAHWGILVAVAVVLIRVLNVTTKHWSAAHPGLGRWCLYLIDMLDVFKATPPPGGGK